jgi:hypothetical protein
MKKLILAVAACALYGVSAGAQSEAPKPADAHQIVVEDVQHSHFGGRLRVAIAEEKQLVTEIARRLAGIADAVVVAVGFTRDSEGEGADRTCGLPGDGFGKQERHSGNHFGRSSRCFPLDRKSSGVSRTLVSRRTGRHGFRRNPLWASQSFGSPADYLREKRDRQPFLRQLLSRTGDRGYCVQRRNLYLAIGAMTAAT